MDIDGFQSGYLRKEAVAATAGAAAVSKIPLLGSAAGSGVALGGYASGKLAAMALLLPIIVGVTAGTSVSKMTSPSGTDTDNMQKSVIAGELEESIAELKRKKAFATEEEPSGKSPREIRY